jgi:hypothetical protein
MKICQGRYDACFKTTTLPTCRLGHRWRVRHIRARIRLREGRAKVSTSKTTFWTSVKRAYKAGKRVLSVKKDLKCFGANENTCRLNYHSGKSILKVSGIPANCAKLYVMNFVLVLLGKRPLRVQNVIYRNCTLLLSLLHRLLCNLHYIYTDLNVFLGYIFAFCLNLLLNSCVLYLLFLV